jgi:hypothetical protein
LIGTRSEATNHSFKYDGIKAEDYIMRFDYRYKEFGCLIRKQFGLPENSVFLTEFYTHRMIKIIRAEFEAGYLNKRASDYLIFNIDLITSKSKTE